MLNLLRYFTFFYFKVSKGIPSNLYTIDYELILDEKDLQMESGEGGMYKHMLIKVKLCTMTSSLRYPSLSKRYRPAQQQQPGYRYDKHTHSAATPMQSHIFFRKCTSIVIILRLYYY